MSRACGSFYRGLLPPPPRGDFAGLVAPAPTSGPTRPTPGVPFVSRRKEPKACQGLRPLDPLGALSSPQRHDAARRCRFPPEGLSTEGVGKGAGLFFPPRWIRDRAIKGRVVTKPSLYLKTNSCNEGQNFSIYIPFYKISFYKSWLLSLQKGCFLASLSHFWLQPSLQRTCNEHRIFCKLYEQIVARLRPIWFYTNQTKLRCPDFVAL